MKCMNLKCDSEEFNMGHSYSLTDPEEEEYFWVGCDECETAGPACKTAEEARSYFEDQPAEYAPKLNSNFEIETKWSDEIAHPIEDIKKFSSCVRNEILTVFKTRKECIEKMQSLTPVLQGEINSGLELEKDALKDFSDEIKQEAEKVCNAWNPVPDMSWITPMSREGEKLEDFRQRVMDRIAQSVPIPTEVLNMEFNSKYSAYRETLIIAKIRSICQMARGAAAGASLEAFAKRLKDDDLQSENGEMAMEGFKGKLLGIPFDMSKEREIKIPKPLPPGPTQIADSPVPQIADSPTPAINIESFSDKCHCGSKAEVTATTVKCTNPECYHYKE